MEDFISYQEALALKELGFNDLCRYSYYQDGSVGSELSLINYNISETLCSRPTFSQSFRFFRKNYNIDSWIEKYLNDEFYIFQIPFANFEKIQGYFETYEECELKCLQELIKITNKIKSFH